jgi:hypothetical protein
MGCFSPFRFGPDLAPPINHLFGPAKDALCGYHFADDSELKQVFVMCSIVEARNFTTLVCSILHSVDKKVLKMIKTL